jgi:amino acid permease
LTSYIGVPIFMVLYLGHRSVAARSEPWVYSLLDVDLRSGLAEVIERERELAPCGEHKVRKMVPAMEIFILVDSISLGLDYSTF